MIFLRLGFKLSERRACSLIRLGRSTMRYISKKDDLELKGRLSQLAGKNPRYGYRRLTILLNREGWGVNRKKVYRLYRAEGLEIRKKTPKRRVACKVRSARPDLTNKNQRWSMDFMSDALFNRAAIRLFTLVDNYTRESLAIEVGRSLRGRDVVATLDAVGVARGLPASICCDNGSEFTSKVVDKWAYLNGVELDFSGPGKPVDNAYIESFNGRLREECLNQHWFLSMEDARQKVERWRQGYNWVRPHSSLGNYPPVEFAAGLGHSRPGKKRQSILE